MKNQEKTISVLQSIINLVPKGFHKMCESSTLGTLFSVKPKNWSKNFLKSPFFANLHKISIFENQNPITRLILTCLFSYLTHYAHTYLLISLLKLLHYLA